MKDRHSHPAIELQHISFSYPGESALALDDVSLTMETGRCYCIVGPNGCGKSTLFRILLGLDVPVKGHYYLDGEEVTAKKLHKDDFAAALHRKIGFLFQNSEVQLFTRSVEDEVAFGLEQLGLPAEEIRNRTDRYLSLFQLEGIRHRAPFSISGGEQKRTALAAVVAMEPEILVLDEPLSGLDEDGQEWMTRYIRETARDGRLYIIATHSQPLVDAVADEVIHMDKHHRITTIEPGK